MPQSSSASWLKALSFVFHNGLIVSYPVLRFVPKRSAIQLEKFVPLRCKRTQDDFEIHSCAERANDVTYFLALLRRQFAGVAELADAYGSGPYGGNPMEVQVLSPAPFEIERPATAGLFRALR